MGLNKYNRNKQEPLKKDTRTWSIKSMAEDASRIFGAGRKLKEKKVEQRKDKRRNAQLTIKVRKGKKREWKVRQSNRTKTISFIIWKIFD